MLLASKKKRQFVLNIIFLFILIQISISDNTTSNSTSESNNDDDSSNSSLYIILGIILGFILILCGLFLLLCCKYRRETKYQAANLQDKNKRLNIVSKDPKPQTMTPNIAVSIPDNCMPNTPSKELNSELEESKVSLKKQEEEEQQQQQKHIEQFSEQHFEKIEQEEDQLSSIQEEETKQGPSVQIRESQFQRNEQQPIYEL